jgi:hypothetical protein
VKCEEVFAAICARHAPLPIELALTTFHFGSIVLFFSRHPPRLSAINRDLRLRNVHLRAGAQQCVQKLLVLSTCALLVMDQRTLQVKYRIPINDIFRISLSPYNDDIAIVHVRCVSALPVCALCDGQSLSPFLPFFGTRARTHAMAR